MCYFDPEKIKKAYELLKKREDFVEANKDVMQIDNIIYSNYKMYDKDFLRRCDIELRQKYIEIDVLEILATTVNWRVPDIVNQDYQPNIPEIEQLKFDKFCIMARILKTSGEIVKLSDFFDNRYIGNN